MAKNIFNSIQLKKPGRSFFDMSHDLKFSCNMGELIPVFHMECMPGDKVSINTESLIRLAPMVAPMMHRVDVYAHTFKIPIRLLWDNWENFITNTETSPGILPTMPYVQVDINNWTPLMDYMGIPKPVGGTVFQIRALEFAAYQFVYNTYYRDQNLVPEVPYQLNDGANTLNLDLYKLRLRAWEHDYFTACLPFAQKGAAVELPLAMQDVQISALTNNPVIVGNAIQWDNIVGSPHAQSSAVLEESTTLGGIPSKLFLKGEDVQGSTTINDFRQAMALQKFLEKNARGGTRYKENILAHFGVNTSDARLDRPEYVTGLKTPIQISEVLNTTGETGAPNPLPQGNMAGHGISAVNGGGDSTFCEEHCFIMTFMSVRPKTAYQQGIARHWKKFENLDYPWPEFAHLGEQEVLNEEVYAEHALPGGVFGYLPRYAEYKFSNNRVAGDFRTTLDFWHMGRIFTSDPALNQSFVECDPTTRVFAVTAPNTQHLWIHCLNKVGAIRPLPKFGTPM